MSFVYTEVVMAVLAYINRDTDGHPWPPVHEHEASATIGLVQRLFEAVGAEPELYIVCANLQAPRADIVVISELGVGVAELKHYSGELRVINSEWFAGSFVVRGGSKFKNPRQQVQAYARDLRFSITPFLAGCWGVEQARLQDLRFQSAVCFTNPHSIISPAVKQFIEYGPRQARWQHFGFKLLTPADFAAWAVALRFGLEHERAAQFAPFRLSADQQVALAEQELRGSEWTELRNLLPLAQPYAYLLLSSDAGEPQFFPLRRIETVAGRDTRQCTLVLPAQYRRVSRQHARFTRIGRQVWLEDLSSTHGTFVNGQRISQITLLHANDQIVFGGALPEEPGCTLVLQEQLPAQFQASSTSLTMPNDAEDMT